MPKRRPQAALSLGRRVDALFKAYATQGVVPVGRGQAAVMCRHAITAARRSSIRVDGANEFVRHGGIKTHIDGLGWCGPRTRVVLELKSTSKTLDQFDAAWHTPCKNQPTASGLPNTEHTHHMLQLGWTTRAYRKSGPPVPENQVTGMLVVAAADGARVMPVEHKYTTDAFWNRLTSAVGSGGGRARVNARAPASVPEWPKGVGCRALAAAVGSPVEQIVANGRVALTACGGGAVCTTKPLAQLTQKHYRAMARAVASANAHPGWVLHPTPAGWRVRPLPATKQSKV